MDQSSSQHSDVDMEKSGKRKTESTIDSNCEVENYVRQTLDDLLDFASISAGSNGPINSELCTKKRFQSLVAQKLHNSSPKYNIFKMDNEEGDKEDQEAFENINEKLWNLANDSTNRSQLETSVFRKRKRKIRNYRKSEMEEYPSFKTTDEKQSGKLQKWKYPKNWDEFTREKWTFKKLSSKFASSKNITFTDIYKQLSFESPSETIKPFECKKENGEIFMIPFEFLRYTLSKPRISYSVNTNQVKEAFLTRHEVLTRTRSSYRSVLEKLYEGKTKFRDKSEVVRTQRHWYHRNWKCTENSINLSFVHDYSDGEKEEPLNFQQVTLTPPQETSTKKCNKPKLTDASSVQEETEKSWTPERKPEEKLPPHNDWEETPEKPRSKKSKTPKSSKKPKKKKDKDKVVSKKKKKKKKAKHQELKSKKEKRRKRKQKEREIEGQILSKLKKEIELNLEEVEREERERQKSQPIIKVKEEVVDNAYPKINLWEKPKVEEERRAKKKDKIVDEDELFPSEKDLIADLSKKAIADTLQKVKEISIDLVEDLPKDRTPDTDEYHSNWENEVSPCNPKKMRDLEMPLKIRKFSSRCLSPLFPIGNDSKIDHSLVTEVDDDRVFICTDQIGPSPKKDDFVDSSTPIDAKPKARSASPESQEITSSTQKPSTPDVLENAYEEFIRSVTAPDKLGEEEVEPSPVPQPEEVIVRSPPRASIFQQQQLDLRELEACLLLKPPPPPEEETKPFSFSGIVLAPKKSLLENSNWKVEEETDEDESPEKLEPKAPKEIDRIEEKQDEKIEKHDEKIEESPSKLYNRSRTRSPSVSSKSKRRKEDSGRRRPEVRRDRKRSTSPSRSRYRHPPSPRRRRVSLSPPSSSSSTRRRSPPPSSSRRRRLYRERRYDGSPRRRRSPPQASPNDRPKRSVADSTISDDLLPRYPSRERSVSPPPPSSSNRRTKFSASPTRVSLDERINRVLQMESQPPVATPPTDHWAMHDYPPPTATTSSATDVYLGYNMEYPLEAAAPPPPKVLQVGNILQVVPTEELIVPPPTPTIATTETPTVRVVQVGNMLQIVPTEILPPMPPPPPVVDEKSNAEATVPAKNAERQAERLRKRKAKEERRKDKEKRRKEREKKRKLRLKISTDEMIKKALELDGYIDDNRTERVPEVVNDTPGLDPSRSILHKSERSSNQRKSVQFADGVRPGEGTSPSAGEELSSPPPRAKKSADIIAKRKRKRKVKVRVVKKRTLTAPPPLSNSSDEEYENLPPPSPPPGSPPPEVFPPRFKVHTINNVPQHYLPNFGVTAAPPQSVVGFYATGAPPPPPPQVPQPSSQHFPRQHPATIITHREPPYGSF